MKNTPEKMRVEIDIYDIELCFESIYDNDLNKNVTFYDKPKNNIPWLVKVAEEMPPVKVMRKLKKLAVEHKISQKDMFIVVNDTINNTQYRYIPNYDNLFPDPEL